MSALAGTAAPGIVIDELALFEADLAGGKPCELVRVDKGNTLCGEPAAICVPVTCWLCHVKAIVWICLDCHENIWKPSNGELTCDVCLELV